MVASKTFDFVSSIGDVCHASLALVGASDILPALPAALDILSGHPCPQKSIPVHEEGLRKVGFDSDDLWGCVRTRDPENRGGEDAEAIRRS